MPKSAPRQTDVTPRSEESKVRLATDRPIGDLRPHLSYIEHSVTVSASRLSLLADRAELALSHPIWITTDGIIIDGYARWQLAKHMGRESLDCFVYDLSPEDALRELIRTHCSSRGFPPFVRIELALDMEPYFQKRATSHQAAGGENKGLSKLAKAQRIDTRLEIAKLARVGAGNVRKAKNVLEHASPDLLQAVREEEVSINLADKWCHEPKAQQSENLRVRRIERGIAKKVRLLLPKSKAPSPLISRPEALSLADFVNLLDQSSAGQQPLPPEFRVEMVRIPGKAIFVTEELLRTLTTGEDVTIEPEASNQAVAH
jgi:hypothetical protein